MSGAGDGFDYHLPSMRKAAGHLGNTFGQELQQGGESLHNTGQSLLEHASGDASGIGATLTNFGGKGLEIVGDVFKEAGGWVKRASGHLEGTATAHEENETNITNNLRGIHPDDKTPHIHSTSGETTPSHTSSGTKTEKPPELGGKPSGKAQIPDEAPDPTYGKPHSEHGESKPIPGRPEEPSGYDVDDDPKAPYGRGDDGKPLTKQEYDERYVQPNGWDRYPPNAGAVPGTRWSYDDPNAFAHDHGVQFDRIGTPEGKYFGVVEDGRPATFGERSLPAGNIAKPYSQYTFNPHNMPPGWKIEASKIAPGFGRPGGGTQVLIMNSKGEVMTGEQLMDAGILT